MAAATAPPSSYGDYPLKDIPAPHPHDVLCGRGGGTNNHIGNSHWRMLVAANKQLYITLPKRQKMLLSRSIVNAVRSQNPAGRFLQKDSKTNKWFDVGDQRAQEKTSQALREGAPDIRKKVAAETGNVESTEKSTKKKSEPRHEAPDDDEKHDEDDAEERPNQATSNGTPAVAAAPPEANSAQPTPPPQAQHPPQQHGVPMQPYPIHPGMHHPPHGYPGGYYAPQPGMMPYPPQAYPGMAPPMHGYPPHMMMHQQMAPGMPPPQPQMMHNPHHQQMHHHNMPPPDSQNNGLTNDSEPIPYAPNSARAAVPSFDDYVANIPPPDGGLEPAGLSFGSVMMTDGEITKLQQGGTSFGTAMSLARKDDHAEVPEAPGALEPPGTSFGNMSMMSVGTTHMDKQGGFSFGSMMSYNTTKTEMPDGGLEAIGTSFGSLSLDTTNRDTLFQQLELAAAGPEIPPMLNTTKSTSNLLECSDTESEDEESNQQLIARKSAAWEKMRDSITPILVTQKSNELMPPPPAQSSAPARPADKTGTVLSVPETNFDRDFSALSAFEFDGNGEDDEDPLPAPPAELIKTDEDDDNLDMYLISQAQS